MDNFTLAVIVSMVVMMIVFVALIVLDKPRPEVTGTMEPAKASGKRPA